MELLGQRARLRQCQPRNKYRETFYTLFTFPVHDLPGTPELIYAPSVPLRSVPLQQKDTSVC